MRSIRYHEEAREEFLHEVPKKFKFSLVYVPYENEILILAVAPFRKKPGYWKARRS